MGLKRAQRQQVAQAADAVGQPQSDSPASILVANTNVAATTMQSSGGQGSGVEIDSSNDRAWRQTLLKVAELLIERHPDAAVGYRLRRHAVWAGITAPPVTIRDVKTQLAPMSVDLVDEYKAAMGMPTLAIWQRVSRPDTCTLLV